MGIVMLRFPEGEKITTRDLFDRRRLCADAQRACDRGEDIVVPYGVEVIVRVGEPA